MEMKPRFSKIGRPGLWKCFCLKSRRRVTAEEAVEELDRGRVISTEKGDGVMRVKIVMSKQELKQMVASMGHKQMVSPPLPPQQSLEQLLHALRRRHMKRAESVKSRSGWMPALQSIPEEN